jgi:hypothetical protein
MDGDDEYSDLFVESHEPKERIARIIKPYMKFDKEGNFVYEDLYDTLAGKKKVLLHLLGTKVLSSKGLREEEGMTVQELVDTLGMSRGSVEGYIYGSIKNLVNSDGGQVHVPNYKIGKVAEILGEGSDE